MTENGKLQREELRQLIEKMELLLDPILCDLSAANVVSLINTLSASIMMKTFSSIALEGKDVNLGKLSEDLTNMFNFQAKKIVEGIALIVECNKENADQE